MAHSSGPSPSSKGSHAAPPTVVRKQQQQLRSRRVDRSASPMGRVIVINAPEEGGEESEDIHTITVDKSADGRLGFSVRGGSEHGLSIFVSKVEEGSSAALAGLRVGDKLVEVNGVSLENISMGSAVKVLTGNQRLRMVVRRVGKVPGIRYSREKTTWVDLIHRRMVVEEVGTSASESSGDSGALRRIVHLYTTSDDSCLGFNIRGGNEFGLGIYISKLDPGGLAEQNGIKMGDQILAANGFSFEDISHSQAVEVLKSHTHIMLTIKEAGRYPAYKEMVAEYSWLNQSRNSSSQGSDSASTGSSMSSGTPLSSVSGLSQMLLTPAGERVEASMQTEGTGGTTSRSRVELLQDTLIGGESRKTSLLMALSRPSQPIRRTQSHMTVAEETQKKRQKEVLQREKEKEEKEKGGEEKQKSSTLQRSKTFVNLLLRRHTTRGRSKSPTGKGKGARRVPDAQALAALASVEDMAWRLLGEEEVTTVITLCGRYLTDGIVEDLVRHLLAILDRPEKLLLLREVRLLVPVGELELFNSLVAPFEQEAYDILKCRTLRSPPLRSPQCGRTPRRQLITPVPDFQGGFELQRAEELEREKQLLEELDKLRLSKATKLPYTPSSSSSSYDPPRRPPSSSRHPRSDPPITTKAFTPLLDIPVDTPRSMERPTTMGQDTVTAPRTTPTPPLPNWLLAENTTPRHMENGSDQSSKKDRATGTQRGRFTLRSGKKGSKGKGEEERRKKGKEEEEEEEKPVFTVGDVSRYRRPPLSQVFRGAVGSDSTSQSGGLVVEQQLNGQRQQQQRRQSGAGSEEEYELTSVCVSKTKQSLGISISGGVESRVQPVVKIEKIFPGGAASTSEVLRAGYELVSVDGVSLEGVTHLQAVDIIRQAFSNKAKDPMEFVVKVPKDR